MGYQPIVRGSSPGDKNGEIIYFAWEKTDEMFEELYQIINKLDTYPFVKISGAFVKKATGNTSRAFLEINDIVIWKEIGNNGDPRVLMGYTYKGNDVDVITSYQLENVIST